MISFIVYSCLFFVFTKASFESNSTDCSYFLSPTGIDQKNSTDFASLSFALKQFIANKPNETNAIICLKKGVFQQPNSFDLTSQRNFTIGHIKSLEIKSVDGIAEIVDDVLIFPRTSLKVDFEKIIFDSVVIGEAASVIVQSRELVLRSFQSQDLVSLSVETLSMSDVVATKHTFSVGPFLKQSNGTVLSMKKVSIENSTFGSSLEVDMRGDTVVDIDTTAFKAGMSIATSLVCHSGPSSITFGDVSVLVPGNATRQFVLGGDCVRNITLSNVHISTPLNAPLEILAVNIRLLNVTTIDKLRFDFPSGARKSMTIVDSELNFLQIKEFADGFSAPHFTMSGSKITCNGGYMPFQCGIPPNSGRKNALSSCTSLDNNNITACISPVCNNFDQYSTKDGLSCVTCESPKELNKAKNKCILPEPCSATNNSPDCVDCKDGYFDNKTHACASCLALLHEVVSPTGCVCEKGYYFDDASLCVECDMFTFTQSFDGRCEMSNVMPVLIAAGGCCLCGVLVFLVGVVLHMRKKRKNDYMMPEMNEPLLR